MPSALQHSIEKQRAVYETLARPLLAQICTVHSITIREFAAMFEISRAYAEAILNHKKFPNLELGLKIARYFEVTVEELFGWRLDDTGERRPLLIELKGTGQTVRLSARDKGHGSISVTVAVAEEVKRQHEEAKRLAAEAKQRRMEAKDAESTPNRD